MIELPREKWNRVVNGQREQIGATFECPKCGETGSLMNHAIAADGTVSPSVICSYNCGFHDHIKLLGWQP